MSQVTEYKIPDELLREKRYRPHVEFDFVRQMRYLHELRREGRQYIAAERAGVTDAAVRNLAKANPEFAQACHEAIQAYVDEVLIAEAQRRAVEGVSRPIIGGKFRDEVVAHEQVYSDGLLKMLICGRRAEYRDGGGAAELGKFAQEAGGVLVIPLGPTTVEDWEKQMGAGSTSSAPALEGLPSEIVPK